MWGIILTMEEKKKDPGPPLKILLADDTAVNVALATKLMKRRGHDITTVENGLQAYEAFQKDSFDVILMDIHMPVMDGLESTQKIREYEASNPDKPPTPIIAMTANNEASDHETYLNSGMNGIITKPLEIKKVVSQIREIIEKFLA
ncbi:MAG: response regulator [Nitrospinae bacterium]|nr:response regulator [Nitrospinota bacterium]MZH14839.1 response regulator [Nitrospinota bacterium]